jgi:hypothetical protein
MKEGGERQKQCRRHTKSLTPYDTGASHNQSVTQKDNTINSSDSFQDSTL